MTKKLTATEAKAKILALLDEVVAAGDEVEITKHGRTVARLVPATGPHALEGSLAGVAMTAAEDEELFATGGALGSFLTTVLPRQPRRPLGGPLEPDRIVRTQPQCWRGR